MNNTPFQSYNEQLQQLTKSIHVMGGLVTEMIVAAREALTAKDDRLRDAVRELDKQVNGLEFAINEQATTMIALRTPMADDLRFVTSALRIAGDLENAGDLAKNISKRSIKLGDYSPVGVIEMMGAMVDNVLSVMSDALLAFETRNATLAIDVWKRDKGIDGAYRDILKTLQDDMQAHPETIPSATHFLFAAKNFERIADHAINVARTVYYVTTGVQADKTVLKAANQES